MSKPRLTHSQWLRLRVTAKALKILKAAAAASKKTVREFVLDAALSEAERMVAHRRLFLLDAARWDALVAMLDAPPRRHPRLERLFRASSFFDRKP